MKGATFVYLVTGVLIVVTTNVPGIQSQDCEFIGYDPEIDPEGIVVYVNETTSVDTVILTKGTSSGSVICDDPKEEGNTHPRSYYIDYSHKDNVNLTFTMKQAISDDLDNGQFAFKPNVYLSTLCQLTCSEGNTASLRIYFRIEPENTQTPQFNYLSADLTMDENFPLGLDFTPLFTSIENPLNVSDRDLPVDPQGLIKFDVSDPSFEVVVDNSSTHFYYDSKNQLRVSYQPKIVVAKPLNAKDSPYKIDIIATDQGMPPRESRFPITITVNSQDLRDPAFDLDYYTSTISDTEFKGILVVNKRIRAYDGDLAINSPLSYKIKNDGGLNVTLINQDLDGVDVELLEPIGNTDLKMAYVVIEAYQDNDETRKRTVVLAVELPPSVITTTSTSTISSTTITGETCPPSSTSIVTCETTTNPSSTPQECTPCPISTSAAPCLTFDPSTDCPSGTPVTGDPVSTMTTNPSQFSSTSSSPGSSITTTVFSTTNPSTASVTATVTETGIISSTSTNCADCPTVTCPTVTCPTGSNTIDPSSSSQTPPNTVSTPCPVTCPASTSTPTCDCPTTTAAAVTVPTITTPSGNPTVQFEKQQYSSEVIENTPVNTIVVIVRATSTSPNEQPVYTLKESFEKKYFSIDPDTGIVRTAQSLPIGTYNLTAVARIPSGDEDVARVVVEAVKGTLCNGTQFSSPLYEFPFEEHLTGTVGQIELRSTEDIVYNLVIASSDPPSMMDHFDLKGLNENSWSVIVIKPLNWSISGRVTLTISAMDQRGLRMTLVQTIVNVNVVDVNEAPKFVESSVIIGYPQRTYFDPAVPMPIYKAKAYDGDSKENAILSFHVAGGLSQQNFDVDLQTGTLFVKGIDILDTSADLRVQVTVRDNSGLSDKMNVTVKSLSDDFISLMKTNSASESLTEETIAGDLSRILSYRVVVLRMEKSVDSDNNAPASKSGFNYYVNLYALNQTAFVTRTEFIEKVNKGNFTGLSWTKVGDISGPSVYKADSVINKLTKETQSYTIATAVLATVLGLTLILILAFIIYDKKHNIKRPWSQAFSAGSLEVDKKQWDQRSFANADDDEPAEPQVDSYNRELSGETNQGASKSAIRFSAEKKIIPGEMDKTAKTTTEDEAYCPPTPVPKKSILKDPNFMDSKSKQLEDTGVKFDPTPEVIQVAATTSVPVTDLDNGPQDDDEDLLMEVF